MGFLALVIFWDYRAALAGAIYSAAFTYLWTRKGGFGYRVEAHQQRELAERGDLGVRPRWLIRAAMWVVATLLALAVIMYLLDQVM